MFRKDKFYLAALGKHSPLGKPSLSKSGVVWMAGGQNGLVSRPD
jgi:hypothetical protein